MIRTPLHILLVEDNPGDVRLIRELLRDSELSTSNLETSGDLGSALGRLEAETFDVLILDLSLPDSQGLDTFAAVHARAIHTPIVILTGLDDEDTALRAVGAGAQDYLTKSQIQAPLLVRALLYAIERKRVEKEIRRLNADLDRRVTARTAELAATNQELEAFAYSVSHDLRAPLRHMDGYARLLREYCAGQLDQEALHYLDAIVTAAKTMGTLIDELLRFARTGRTGMRTQRVELDALVGDVRRELAPTLGNRTLAWTVGPLPPVEGDPGLLRIVFTNLLSNAVKFTAPRAEARIDVSATAGNDGEVIVSVRDNGVGFDMRYADKLFGVFQRLHSTEQFEGTGIGLATVRRIITRHGGRVWGEGAVDGGATFSFSLKAADRI